MSKFKPGDMVIANQDFSSPVLDRGLEKIVEVRKCTFGRVLKEWTCPDCGGKHFSVLFVINGQEQIAAPRQEEINHISHPN